LHSAIQNVRDNLFISTYKSSADPDYANNPRTAATGFAYIQGAVGTSATYPHGKTVHYITAVVAGMVPGCPGKPFPTATLTIDSRLANTVDYLATECPRWAS